MWVLTILNHRAPASPRECGPRSSPRAPVRARVPALVRDPGVKRRATGPYVRRTVGSLPSLDLAGWVGGKKRSEWEHLRGSRTAHGNTTLRRCFLRITSDSQETLVLQSLNPATCSHHNLGFSVWFLIQRYVHVRHVPCRERLTCLLGTLPGGPACADHPGRI